METQLHRKLNLRFKIGLGAPQPLMNLALKEAYEAVEQPTPH